MDEKGEKVKEVGTKQNLKPWLHHQEKEKIRNQSWLFPSQSSWINHQAGAIVRGVELARDTSLEMLWHPSDQDAAEMEGRLPRNAQGVCRELAGGGASPGGPAGAGDPDLANINREYTLQR